VRRKVGGDEGSDEAESEERKVECRPVVQVSGLRVADEIEHGPRHGERDGESETG
jgi:hypothetical protein